MSSCTMHPLIFRFAAVILAGAAALLAVFALDAEIEDLAALLGAVRGESDYQPLASDAASACGARRPERESCKTALAPNAAADAPAFFAGRPGL